jgi:hypothetical protein
MMCVSSILVLALCLAVIAGWRPFPLASPLNQRIAGARFEQASLAEVLAHIARQRQKTPSWRFYVYDEELANGTVSLEIPDGCTLEEALEIVCGSVKGEYEWHWFKTCGHSASPDSARFHLRPAGAEMSRNDHVLHVSRWEAVRPQREP